MKITDPKIIEAMRMRPRHLATAAEMKLLHDTIDAMKAKTTAWIMRMN